MPKVRETCTACSIRRQRCDKKTPCTRCVKRGNADNCTRQWTGQRASQHVQPRTPELRGRRISANTQDEVEQSLIRPVETVTTVHSIADEDVAAVDFMLWKPHEIQTTRTTDTQDLFGVSQMGRPNHVGDQLSGINLLQTLLPNVDMLWKLINFHEKKLLWYHGCYHGPTFNSQVEDRLNRQNARDDDVLQIHVHDLQWTALLFAIIAGSLTSANRRMLMDWGFSTTESPQLCTQWYTATISCLKLANFTSDHNILGAQAIATLTMCAHTLGFSGDLHVHLGSAVRIAQSLNLHRIKASDEKINPHSSDEARQMVLKKEIGRRLWSQLCIQDWFSIPLAEAHSIHRGHFSTKKPANRDHITMELLNKSIPTYVSYGNYLYEIAALIAEMHSRNSSLNTDYTRYQLVLEYDTRMRELATSGRPHYFDMTVAVEPSWPWFVPWARRSLTICFAHKIMMIHRAFLKRSFTNDAFSFTRRTCIAASKTILNEAKIERKQDEPIVWIDSAFCIAAAITLALDISHRDPSESDCIAHKRLIQDCVQMLEKQNNSTLALRGTRLLQILLQRSSTDIDADLNVFAINGSEERGSGREATSALPILTAIHSTATRTIESNRSAIPLSHNAARPGLINGGTDQNPDSSSIDDLFAELFPPQAGFSNAYLFEELLDLSLDR